MTIIADTFAILWQLQDRCISIINYENLSVHEGQKILTFIFSLFINNLSHTK